MTATLSQIDQLIEAARRQLDGLVALRADMAGEPGSEVESFTDHDFAPSNLLELPLASQRVGIARGREAEMTSYSLALAKISRLQGQGS
ncbi:hypothetical protein [Rhizobium leguminosarum]|uniref:hypothetical protein n=1 Tax=Rhizobium leguminosarum TaxID=384 RepID=UPI00103D0D1A|nr:hypothetical protein [Rhizobium leguminosarum]TCA70471.1 hypothetical protein E0H69_25590 [Rhizobium leguminosarum bv. viciae]